MPSTYYILLTDAGAIKKAAKEAASQTLVLTEFAVGDGGGVYVAPDGTWVGLTNEVYRTDLNQIYQHSTNPNYLVCEGIIPQANGGFYVRELGIFDEDGDLIMVGAYPETYKPTLAEGAARDLYIRAITEFGSSDVVNISVDPSIILATRDPATETYAGILEIATPEEALRSLDHSAAMTPHALRSASAGLMLARHITHVDDQMLTAGDGDANDKLGNVVALSADGNTALAGAHWDDIGANGNQGSAYVFVRDGDGVWTQQTQLTSSDGDANDYFGRSVALSADGNTAIVGAAGDDVGANVNQGSAYVFVRDAAGAWTEQEKITASDGAAADNFGSAAALSADGNTAIVGANGDDLGGGASQGSAYIFTRDAAGAWTEEDKVTAGDGAAADNFGSVAALSADGNTAIVGANGDDLGGGASQGSAYIFTRDAAGVWTEEDKLSAGDGATVDRFGGDVAISASGNVALVGAYADDVGAVVDQGSAYLFTRDAAGVWTEQQKLTAADGAADDFFGNAVALSADGNVALVGANSDDVGGTVGQGSVYVFTRDWVGAELAERGNIVADDGAAGDGFGNAVALSACGTTALVGAQQDTVDVNAGQGSAHAFVQKI